MDNKQTDIIICKGTRSVWGIVTAGICFTAILGVIYSMIFTDGIEDPIDVVLFGMMLLLIGVGFLAVTNIHFDLAKRRYKKEIAIGKIGLGKWYHLPNIEYVSVFKQGTISDDGRHPHTRSNRYDVNVWYGISKHFTIYSSVEMEPAYDMAIHIAVKLNTDMLDATMPNDFKWVELPAKDIRI